MSPTPPIVLSIAATDPTSGAGIQADLLTLAALGCHPVSVVTAITAQDTHGVEGVFALDAQWVSRQAAVLLRDVSVAAIKIGVLGSAANAEAVANVLAAWPAIPVVLDPVLASGRGDPLADDALIAALRTQLLPRTTVLTPNLVEARRLGEVAANAGREDCARALLALGCRNVFVTGTHDDTQDVVNSLFAPAGKVREDRWPRLPGAHHGSGCTLAAALAGFIALGRALPEAAQAAQEFTWHALAGGFGAGGGQQIPDRFFGTRRAPA
ncbi:MAG: hydroxymethylpyrimidine/phosphomethylpyrimidine kinase [Proteobacteria bacterium]|nr:hydroxymethylpyrimidine/phosphomethylpyrimidine kinase [Pseudomonadota bacterium]